jgi:hypothetical protein
MLILTLKARRLITRAVNAYGNDHQREIWRAWSASHQDVRRGPADAFEDGAGAFPPEVATVAHSVLNQMFDAQTRRLNSGTLSEDEEADLSNDIAFIRSVVNLLNRHAPRQTAVAQGVTF